MHYSLPSISNEAVVYSSFPPSAQPKHRIVFPSTNVMFENVMSKDGERQAVREPEPCFAIGSGNGDISIYRGGSCVER